MEKKITEAEGAFIVLIPCRRSAHIFNAKPINYLCQRDDI